MKTKALSAPVLSLLVLALSSCGGGGGGEETTAAAESVATAPDASLERAATVEIIDFAYDPEPVRVQTGGKVIWKNMDSAPHTATADDGSFDTGTIEEGKLKSETFKEPGTYTYFCEIHPTMHGTVEVVDRE
jgi:plastocyanin